VLGILLAGTRILITETSEMVRSSKGAQVDFEIRECEAADFEKLLPLFRELGPGKLIKPAALHAAYRRGLRSESRAFVCAVHQAEVVGFGSLTVKNSLCQEGPIGHIVELVIRRDSRGRGIGKSLLSRLDAIASERNCRRVELDSAYHRKQAHRFYQQCGFENRGFIFSRVL
jgi:ribosomal protein S18 acetylase RimI-like enzyme